MALGLLRNMAHSKRPAEAGRPVVDALQASNPNRTGQKVQGGGVCPLFTPRTREQALHTAHELNGAAMRCRAAARTHPGATGLTLNRLAGHYAGMARDWFGRADSYPQGGHA